MQIVTNLISKSSKNLNQTDLETISWTNWKMICVLNLVQSASLICTNLAHFLKLTTVLYNLLNLILFNKLHFSRLLINEISKFRWRTLEHFE